MPVICNTPAQQEIQELAELFFKERSEKVFKKLHDRIDKNLKHIARVICKSSDDANDVCQIVYMRIYTSKGFEFNTDKPFYSYISRMVQNESKRLWKTKRDAVEIPRSRVVPIDNNMDITCLQNPNGYMVRHDREDHLITLYSQELEAKIRSLKKKNDPSDNKIIEEYKMILSDRNLLLSSMIKADDMKNSITKKFQLNISDAFSNVDYVNPSEYEEHANESHDSKYGNINYEKVLKFIKSRFSEEDRAFFLDAQMDKNLARKNDNIYDGYFGEIDESLDKEFSTYEQLRVLYNVKTEGCIKSRVFRIKEAIRDFFDGETNYQKYINNEEFEGNINFPSKCGEFVLMVAKILDGVFEGDIIVFHANGKCKIKTKKRNGELDGSFDEFDDKGNLIKSGQYKMGFKHGIWKFYDIEDNVCETIEYYNDEKSVYKITENGELVASGIYED